ncbi:hypothetical protein JZ751_014371 [Albula glossodonta]|uniref:receptor protein-tyrosine kinase n=1 Tax=Albula glossodonta TaxID=121402 RepID=A0A8T2NVT2_9TELE|nr:hypothetical protein JZ751_014371 [Albula glossodonta]
MGLLTLRFIAGASREDGWEEVSGYDDAMNPLRTYQVCNVRDQNQNNWLRTDFIPRKEVLRVYVELKFTVRDCNSIPNIPGSCKETFNLFYYESDTDSATESTPFWMENPYVKVDTIAPDESFSMLESGRVNTKVRSFGPLSKAGFYLAFQDLGACMSLISVRVFYKKCSTTIANFAVFPETATGAEATSLVIAPGTCVPNALEVSVPLKLYCNGDGEWMVPVGACTCMSGFEPAMKDTQCQEQRDRKQWSENSMNIAIPPLWPVGWCDLKGDGRSEKPGSELPQKLLSLHSGAQACSPGTFKSKQGEGFCSPCPPNTIPSAPRNVISNVNETSLVLEWGEPRDSGGRDDLLYNVICKKCLPERGSCSRCDDNVDISPRRLGLTQRRVAVRNLQAHTRYSFEIQAVNGVSSKSPTPPQYATVNITTNQAERPLFQHKAPGMPIYTQGWEVRWRWEEGPWGGSGGEVCRWSLSCVGVWVTSSNPSKIQLSQERLTWEPDDQIIQGVSNTHSPIKTKNKYGVEAVRASLVTRGVLTWRDTPLILGLEEIQGIHMGSIVSREGGWGVGKGGPP